MTKLNYTVNLKDKENKEENENVKHSLNSLSKQAVINQSLGNRVPKNPNIPINNPLPTVQTTGFGRSV